MLKFLKDKKKDNKGFTLVELVIVVAILAILVGILAPQYTKYVEKSRKAADAANLENLVTAFKTAASDGNDQIPVGNGYKITITADGANITVPAGVTETTIAELIGSYAGSTWQTSTKLKSAKWTGVTTDNPFSATINVKSDGSVEVSYNPTDLKDQANP